MTGKQLKDDFCPAWWLRSPHMQTLWAALLRKQHRLDLVEDTVELSDGDFIDLCWSRKSSDRTVLILHGLEGSLSSRYVNGIIYRLEQAGFRPVLMHFRGCSGRVNRLARAYHSGDTGDVSEISDYIKRVTGQPLYAAVGYSLGGNVLLKWLGETGRGSPLTRAVAVSVPFKLDDAASRLDTGLSRLYRNYLLHSLRENYRKKFSSLPSPVTVDVKQLKTFRDYDDKVTAPLHGFTGVDDYYTQCSSRQFLKDIKIPTRIIHSRDDPFMYPDTVPAPDDLGESVELLLTRYGGHVGFINTVGWFQNQYWCDDKIIEFLVDD